MTNRITIFIGLPVIVLSIFMACRSAKTTNKPGAGIASSAATVNSCQQVIRYYSEKAQGENGQEIAMTAAITIDPATKNINVAAEMPGEQKASFDMTIEHFDCSLNTDLTTGEALYTGHIRQQDGSSTKAYLKLEVKNGALVMSNGDPEKKSEMLIYISKWEIIKQ